MQSYKSCPRCRDGANDAAIPSAHAEINMRSLHALRSGLTRMGVQRQQNFQLQLPGIALATQDNAVCRDFLIKQAGCMFTIFEQFGSELF